MTATLILVVLLLWGSFLLGAGYFLTFWIKKKWIRALIAFAVASVFFTLPVRDELKGQEEFEALCKAGNVYQIPPSAVGKKFDLMFSATDYKALSGYTRPVEEKTITYVDAASGEVVATAKAYSAGGGWLVQKKIVVLSSTDGPLLGRDQCTPPAEERVRLREVTNKLLN